MPSKTQAFKHATILFVVLMVFWGLYRFLFQLPEEVEELFIKPLVWLTPTLLLLKREHLGLSSLGFSSKNLFPAVYFAISLGSLFALEGLLINYIKYGGALNFAANLGERAFVFTLFLSLATAIPEEIAFRGFIFNRVWYATGKEWYSNLVTSLAWSLVNVPVAVFVWRMGAFETLLYLFLTFLYGMGAAFVFARTRNIVAPILLHVLWEWPIILFR